MKIDQALDEIENILRKVDPVVLYEARLAHNIHNIIRKLRTETQEETIQNLRRI